MKSRPFGIILFLVPIIAIGFGSCELLEDDFGNRIEGRYSGTRHSSFCYPVMSDTAISACADTTMGREILVTRTDIKNHFAVIYDTTVYLGETYLTSDTFELSNYDEFSDLELGLNGDYAGNNPRRHGSIYFISDTVHISCIEQDGAASSFSFNYMGIKK